MWRGRSRFPFAAWGGVFSSAMLGDGIRGRGAVLAASALLLVVLGVDLHLDVRDRDVLAWMDPYQYYGFALDVVQGRAGLREFEIPSIFPLFVIPFLAIDASVSAALEVNLLALLLLVTGVHRLCRELSLRTPSPLVALLVMSSPLLVGLSRSLYIEFTLTALGCHVFVQWLRFLRAPDTRSGVLFGALLALGYLVKTTFPIFMAAPVAAAVLGRAGDRRDHSLAFVAASVLPVSLAIAVHWSLFASSLGYYRNLGRTALPFMYMMGPPEVLSASSLLYYPAEIGRSLLFLLTPFLLLALLAFWRRLPRPSLRDLASEPVALWLWLLGPLALLFAHPLKEPRYVAPCVVPAVLLVVRGIEALPGPARKASLAAAVTLALAQYVAVTAGFAHAPYLLDRPVAWTEVREALLPELDAADVREAPPEVRELYRKYGRNVAIAGFPPNESLALAWQGFPGVVFDLDTFEDPTRFFGRTAFERFEDLYFLAAINSFNRRSGWRWYYPSLPRETVMDQAEFLIVREAGAPGLAQRAGHERVATIQRSDGPVHVLRARGPTTPYRELHARLFLEHHPTLPEVEARAVARELLIVAVLQGDEAKVRRVLAEFPVLRRRDVPERNIYWVGGYPPLLRFGEQRLQRLLRAPPREAPLEPRD